MSKLLINEQPLQVLPTLAEKIGLNEAIFVQKLDHLLSTNEYHKKGAFWIYKTIEDWQSIFPFWSSKTVQRIIKNLEEKGLILSTSKFNKMKTDRTKWYTINYKSLMEIL